MRSVKLEVFDLPLNQVPYLKPMKTLDTERGADLNEQEIALVKAFATTENLEILG
jgi:hypothetical protein